MSDDGLVSACLDSPLDNLPWLVYADWLEERGDARLAALMRNSETDADIYARWDRLAKWRVAFGRDSEIIVDDQFYDVLRRVVQAMNDNLGMDVGAYAGILIYRHVPIFSRTQWDTRHIHQEAASDTGTTRQ